MPLFEGRELHCHRGGRPVFANLDFGLDAGDALVLTGRNGAGKSTLLRMMAGLLSPVRGMLSWEGRPIHEDREAHRERLHYVGHQDAIKPVLTVSENIATWADLRSSAQASHEDALARFDLTALADSPARLLSAGQRRRLALARLLVTPAPLWLLDEPSVGLDHESVKRLTSAIGDHRRNGGLVVLATHVGLDLPDARHLYLDDLQPAELEELAAILSEDAW